jgi:sugar lactone lactonase YvrE
MKPTKTLNCLLEFVSVSVACCWAQQEAWSQNLFVANKTSDFRDTILRYSNSGVLLGNLGIGAPLHGPVGLAFDSQGNLYVADESSNTILRYSSSGGFLGVFANTGLSQPSGLAFDSSGSLVVCNYGDGSLSRYSPSGNLLSHVMTGVLGMDALALDQHDNIFVSNSNQGPGYGVFRFAPDGSHKTLFASSSELDPRGLVFDRSGNLYIVDNSANSVRRFASDGTDLGTFASTGLDHPFAAAFDAFGNLYVSNQIGGEIHRFSPNGQDLGAFVVIPSPANPVGLAFFSVPEPAPLALLAVGACLFFLVREPRLYRRCM